MKQPVTPAKPIDGRLLPEAPRVFTGRDAVESYFDGVDRVSPSAERSVLDGGQHRTGTLLMAAVELAPRSPHCAATFVTETQTALGLDLRLLDATIAPPIYTIGLPLAGTMSVALTSGKFTAQAGEGLVIDPRELEGMQVTPGTHLIEFDLPKRCMLSLGAELAPGAVGGPPRFAPVLAADLAQRLLVMAVQASTGLLRSSGLPLGRQMLAQRWNEMIALTLLNEQPMVGAPGALSVCSGPAPASLRRALEFIDSHAERDILLSDIASAACVSASSLLRQFNEHLGMSPGAFVRQVRLDRARAELQIGRAHV